MPILYAVIVKLCKLMIEKKSFEEIPLVYASRIPSGFFDWSILKKIEVLHRENEDEKFSFWKKNYLFASQCTYSDSSRQAERKYIYPDLRKYFVHRVKVVIKTCHYHKQVKYEARTCVACMFLVMAMNFLMLL